MINGSQSVLNIMKPILVVLTSLIASQDILFRLRQEHLLPLQVALGLPNHILAKNLHLSSFCSDTEARCVVGVGRRWPTLLLLDVLIRSVCD